MRYFSEDFPLRTDQSHLLPRNELINPITQPEILYNMSYGGKAYQAVSKALDISRVAARVAPKRIKVLATLSYKTVTRSLVV